MDPLRPGDPERIAGYRVLGRLGEGGMGRVYLARSPGGRPVALKVIRTELADDPAFRTRFTREVSAARSVSGVFTAPVLDADAGGSPAWLATGYVAGVSLTEAVTRFGPLSAQATGTLAAGLAEALVAVHAAGLVHRDIKPSNVLLAADGPKLIDFGIARAAAASMLTRSGFIVGSPGFLAPEQAGGGEVGPPADVFSWASVLVYASTGRGPFGEGEALELLFRAVYGEPDLRGVPAELRELLLVSLDKDPERRPTPQHLLATLDAAGEGSGEDRAWLPEPLTQLIVNRWAALLAGDSAPAQDGGPGGASPDTGTAPSPAGPTAPSVPTSRPADRTAVTEPNRTVPAFQRTPERTRERTPERTPPADPRRGAGPPLRSSHPHPGPTAVADGRLAGLSGPGTPPGGDHLPAGRGHRRAPRWAGIGGIALLAAAVTVAAALSLPRLIGADPIDSASSGATPSGSAPSGTTAAVPVRDCGALTTDFSSGAIDPRLLRTNDAGAAFESIGGNLRISAPSGTDVRADLQGRVTAPYLRGPVHGDFTIETQLSVVPQIGYQAAGLLVYQDEHNYVRLERGFGDFDAIAFEYLQQGQHVKLHGPFNGDAAPVRTTTNKVGLKLIRSDGRLAAFWRDAAAGGPWQQLGDETAPLAGDATAGVTVLNAVRPGRKALPATFDSLTIACPGR